MVWNAFRKEARLFQTRAFNVSYVHRVRFVDDALGSDGEALAAAFADAGSGPGRALAFVDDNLARARVELPERIEAWARAHPQAVKLALPIHRVPGGELCKNDPEVWRSLCRTMDEGRLCRQSYALAFGGGAVLDVVGFAASLVHRGIRLVRIPTTTLAQADSGVGVKNAVNAFGKKNFLGTFSPPWAVICDRGLLATLSDDDWRSGFAEVVKVALLKDAALFEHLRRVADDLRRRDRAQSMPVIERAAQLHIDHIVSGGDPFETSRARPLDFGHWSAHKLEQVTGFSVPHGHAVAIGIVLDMVYSAKIGLADMRLAEAARDTFARLGLPTYHPAMADADAILGGLEEFREHLGGRLTVTLVRAPGASVDVHEIRQDAMREAMGFLATWGKPSGPAGGKA